MAAKVFVVATMDTKAEEANFVAERIRRAGLDAVTVDVSASEDATHSKLALRADVSRAEVLAAGQLSAGQLSADRGTAVGQLSVCLGEWLIGQLAAKQFAEKPFAGVVGLGGSGGTSLIAAALRRLPIGLPKLIVSTVASGNTSAYIDCTDLVLFPSVVDVAGLNAVSMDVLQNAAHAMVGMVQYRERVESERPLLGLTMFGVTTPCVMRVKESLERRVGSV